MRLHVLAKRHDLFQIEPVAVQYVEMQHYRAAGAGHRTIKTVEISKQIAVKKTEQRDVGNRCQARRLFYDLGIVIMTDAFFAAFAIAVDKT
ncbi:hypothetical protein D3C78_1458270 [compost metagenome]